MLAPMNIKPANWSESARRAHAAEQQPATVAKLVDLIERRRVPRALPRPEAVELDSDTGWAMWQQSVGAVSATAN